MKGEQFIITQLLLNNPELPISKEINGKSIETILDVIQDEYWKEWRKKLEYSPHSSIMVKNLGTFNIKLSPLKLQLKKVIKRIREARVILEREKQKPDFDINNSKTNVIYQDALRRFKACWTQLEEQRRIIILRTERWNEKQKKLGTPEKIRRDYSWFGFSFLQK